MQYGVSHHLVMIVSFCVLLDLVSQCILWNMFMSVFKISVRFQFCFIVFIRVVLGLYNEFYCSFTFSKRLS